MSDQLLADRIRTIVGEDPNVGEIKMFGGICFMLNNNMLVCSMKDESLLVRVGEARQPDALKQPGAALMDMGGRQMKGYVVVDAAALNDKALRRWIATATDFVGPMPPKEKKAKPAKAGKPR